MLVIPIRLPWLLGPGDTDNSSFTIQGSALKTNITFDYELKSSYSLRVRATDRAGRFVERILSVTVADLPELVGEATVGDGTVQRSSVTHVKLTFEGPVDIAPGAFSLIQRGTNSPVALGTPAITQNSGQTLVTLTFQGALTRAAGALLDGFYQLTVGRFKNLPSWCYLGCEFRWCTGGDGYVFGDQEADKFFAYYGDLDGDGQVGSGRVRPIQSRLRNNS